MHDRLHLEQIVPGMSGTTRRRTLGEADIANFCGVSGDFNTLHTDALAAAETPFGRRIAHGLLVTSIGSGLLDPFRDWATLAYLDVQRRFTAPTFPGDTVHVRWTVRDVRRSTSRADAGIVTLAVEIVNQDGVVVQTGTDVVLVAAAGEAGPGTA